MKNAGNRIKPFSLLGCFLECFLLSSCGGVRPFDDSRCTQNQSEFIYKGISRATSLGGTSVLFAFPSASDATAINVYCETRGGDYSLVATVAPTASSATVSLPHTGTTYTCKAVATTATSSSDGGVTTSVQTTSLTSSAYQGPLLVQAYGDAPTAPTGMPSARQVVLTWLPFTGASSTTSYALVRTLHGATLDTTVSASCSSSSVTSCLVCSSTGATAQTCTDSNIASSPAIYDYTVVFVISGWPEEVPASGDTAYRITVSIPPDDMVLVHRDSVNYEECAWMGAASDPLNHQRCFYSGLGAVPYNTSPGKPALNLPTGYFDFGYDLFMDRWNAGCRWSSTGVGGPSGGSDGQVYYDNDSGNCWVNQSGSWKTVNDSTLPASYLAAAYTNAPTASSSPTPPIVGISQIQSSAVCNALIDPNYGTKRLMRRREDVAAAAWPYLTGEPGALTDAQIVSLQDGINHPVTKACNANGHNGVTPTGFGSGDELARNASTGPDSFMIGSVGTSHCVSRFGAQDLVAQIWEVVSDQLSGCSAATHTCNGAVSSLDSGNLDWQNLKFDGIQGPGGGSSVGSWPFSAPSFSADYYSLPTGIPLVATDGGNALLISGIVATKLHTDNFWLDTDNASAIRGAHVGGSWVDGGPEAGRFTLSFYSAPTDTYSHMGFRCVVPAE